MKRIKSLKRINSFNELPMGNSRSNIGRYDVPAALSSRPLAGPLGRPIQLAGPLGRPIQLAGPLGRSISLRPGGLHHKTRVVKESNLIKAVKSWFGVSTVGLMEEKKQIGYTLLKKSAANCFNSKNENICRSYNYCRYGNGLCVPNDNKNIIADVGSYINSYPTGKVYRITAKISDIEIFNYSKSLKTFICVLEPVQSPNSESIIIFHVGFPVLIPYYYLARIIRLVTVEINKGKKKIILCGHSMGGMWAQQVASYLYITNVQINNVYVVGAGVPLWCNYDISHFYVNRWMFFASSENKVIDQLIGTKVEKETFPMAAVAFEKNYIKKIYSEYFPPNLFKEIGTFLLGENLLFYPTVDSGENRFNLNIIKNNENIEKSADKYSYNNSIHDFKFYRYQLYLFLYGPIHRI
jgi:hypothetical protein